MKGAPRVKRSIEGTWCDQRCFEASMEMVRSGSVLYGQILREDGSIQSWLPEHNVPWADCRGKSREELVEFLETQRAIWMVKRSGS